MSTWIAHHGIPNQKWGVRNGPPYPLIRQKKTSKRKKEKKSEKVLEGSTAHEQIAKATVAKVKAKKKEEVKQLKLERKLAKKAVRAEKQRARAEKKVQKAMEKLEKEKKRILTKGTPKEVLDFQENLTTQELKDVLDRLRQVQQITEMTIPSANKSSNKNSDKKKKEQQKDISKKIDDVFTGLGKVNKYMTTTVNTYDNINKIKKIINDLDKKIDETEKSN